MHTAYMLRKTAAGLLALLYSVMAGSWLGHEFYVSLTEIRYNGDSGRLEISMRIFPDDLDHALKISHGVSSHLGTGLEHPEADSLLGRYLLDHFSVEADGREVVLTFLGKEPESDAIWCYLESEPLVCPASFLVKNSVLFREFSDQVNIVQLYVGEWNRGVLITPAQDSAAVTIGG